MEPVKTSGSQNELEKKQKQQNEAFCVQTVLQSHSKQRIMIPAQNQKHKKMEQDRKPGKNPCTHGHLIHYKVGKNTQWRKDNFFNN